MAKLTYASAERFILSREFFGMKLGLENISRFLASIGSPQLQYRTIHIAGTNGKGSTAAMLASILQAAGYKTGLFTSPHLVSLRERVRVDNRIIPTASVVSFIRQYKRELADIKLSFFELIAAMAFHHFAKVRVDVAVIETGLGGRLDATNVLAPDLTITTDVSLDHVEILGPTINRIAREKAGIIQPDTPHLTGLLTPQAERVIRRQCAKRGAPLHSLQAGEFVANDRATKFDFSVNGHKWRGLEPSLVGSHQIRNAALAVKAVTILKTRGFRIPRRAVVNGLRETKWAARFQILRQRSKPTIVLDVGHNAAGVEAFVDSFQKRFPDKKAKVVTGFVKRKQHQAMFNSLSRIAAEYALVPLNTRRSVDIDDLIVKLDWRDIPYRKFASLLTGLNHVLRHSSKDDIVVIAGSHFLVGEFLAKHLKR